MIKKIALGVLAIIVLILGLAAMQPDSFEVRRSIAVKAPPEKIAPLLTDFRQWASWSPWEKLDPNMKRTFTGAPSGKGAVYEWEGNSDVGKGRMEIIDASTPAKTVVKLAFLEPVESHSTTEFTLTPQGDTTTVTWNMHGPMPFLSKLMTVFMNMDDMIGKDFDKGLAQLKTAAEK
ncbi:polyketide cyclase [Massilia eurypsychrophila]|uniref:Polyketide cyclase n=1 Tax=Massilia eurypsychrophila TaxID=1485217 RepID=A0A2G8TE53_9BURK|nr:SRPBCC family protein [Massilia eurypsychrophila]PIL44239.1 polyketide cyclase [Massilia eurypsychrophila]